MNSATNDPWGRRKSFALALGCGVANALLGAMGDAILPFLALAAVLVALLIFVLQVGSRPRPFRWAAWVCLVMSMLAIGVVDLAVFGQHAAGC